MALATVSDYASAARILLQDQTAPFRYSDAEVALALSIAFEEAYRLRPDLFSFAAPPSYTVVDNTAVTMDAQYRMPMVFYVCGWIQMRDDEYSQDSRAAIFLNKAVSILTGIA